MSKTTYHIKESGTALFVIDNGRPFILQKTETPLDKSVGSGVEIDLHVIDAIIPYGAEHDKSFITNIGQAKSIKECQDICNSWTNV